MPPVILLTQAIVPWATSAKSHPLAFILYTIIIHTLYPLIYTHKARFLLYYKHTLRLCMERLIVASFCRFLGPPTPMAICITPLQTVSTQRRFKISNHIQLVVVVYRPETLTYVPFSCLSP